MTLDYQKPLSASFLVLLFADSFDLASFCLVSCQGPSRIMNLRFSRVDGRTKSHYFPQPPLEIIISLRSAYESLQALRFLTFCLVKVQVIRAKSDHARFSESMGGLKFKNLWFGQSWFWVVFVMRGYVIFLDFLNAFFTDPRRGRYCGRYAPGA